MLGGEAAVEVGEHHLDLLVEVVGGRGVAVAVHWLDFPYERTAEVAAGSDPVAWLHGLTRCSPRRSAPGGCAPTSPHRRFVS
ncbi:hypothetical protein ABZT51_24555 [Streptomyces sp. NPDC005373]|uniref:hypothetical protein n=1 Tax=Streptomyces sp. NPDC005373 TaxID=3156879 RepID=UPI0033B96C2F